MQALDIFSKLKGSFSSNNNNNDNNDLLLKEDKNDFNDNLDDIIHPKTIQLSECEELAIAKIESKSYELNKLIENIESSILKLEKLTNENELYLTTTFDDIIFSVKTQKKRSIKEFNKIISDKENKIMEEINDLTLYQTQISKFREKSIKIKKENIMNSSQINDFIINRSMTLINYHENGSIHSQLLINPYIDIKLNVYKTINKYFNNFGEINECKVPFSPNIQISNIGYNSIEVILNEKGDNNTNSEEYKIEMLQLNNRENEEYEYETSNIAYCWQQIAIVITLQFEIKNLKQNTKYLIRCCCKNKYGFGPWCKPKKFITLINNNYNDKKTENDNDKNDKNDKNDNDNKYQYIYLAPTQKYQNKLLKIININNNDKNELNETYLYFKKWKGIHITIGPKLKYDLKDENNKIISHKDIINELYELGLKNGAKSPKKWKINKWKISKWKIGDKYYIVLSFNDNNRLFNISSTYLRARGWNNVKQKNWNITLGINNDLNKLQINEMVNILTNKYDKCQWNWFAITQNEKNGNIIWENMSFPVYQL